MNPSLAIDEDEFSGKFHPGGRGVFRVAIFNYPNNMAQNILFEREKSGILCQIFFVKFDILVIHELQLKMAAKTFFCQNLMDVAHLVLNCLC